MLRSYAALVYALLLGSACVTPGPLPARDAQEAEEYEVLSAVLLASSHEPLDEFLVFERYVDFKLPVAALEEADAIAPGIKASLFRRNSVLARLEQKFPLQQKVHLVTDAERDQFSSEGDRVPLALLRPGFSPDHSIAVVPLEWRAAPLCGAGALYVMQRIGIQWKLLKKITTWAS